MSTALFVPCMAQDICPHVAAAAAQLLQQAGFPAHPSHKHTCCGQALYKQGRFQRAASLAAHCIKAFAGAGRIVSPSASCVAMVHAYPELLRDTQLAQQAQDMAAATFELCAFLDANEAILHPPAWPQERGPVLHHDSCQSRRLGSSPAVRRCLARVPGLKLLELEDPAACCGFGGSFSLDFPEISNAILEDKLDALESLASKTGATTVTTAEISCLCNLQAGLAARGSKLKVLHVAEILSGTWLHQEPRHG